MTQDYPEARLLRQREPYHYQRDRQIGNKQPRPPQPNTNQPNQLPAVMGWGNTTQGYWVNVFNDYLKRKKISQATGLSLGRL